VKPIRVQETTADPKPAAHQNGLFDLDSFGIPAIPEPANPAPEIEFTPNALTNPDDGPTVAIESYRPLVANLEQTVVSGSMYLPIAAITIDQRLQSRLALTEATIADYATLLRMGVILPPVSVFLIRDTEQYVLVDGFHRLLAAKRVGSLGVTATVTPGTRDDAVRAAATANVAHGLPRTPADKRKAIRLLLENQTFAGLSNRALAEMICVDHKTVAAVRERLETRGLIASQAIRTSSDGKKRSVKPAGAGGAASNIIARPNWSNAPTSGGTPTGPVRAIDVSPPVKTFEPADEIDPPAGAVLGGFLNPINTDVPETQPFEVPEIGVIAGVDALEHPKLTEPTVNSAALEIVPTEIRGENRVSKNPEADVPAPSGNSDPLGLMSWLRQQIDEDFYVQLEWSAGKIRAQLITETAVHDSSFLEAESNLDAQIFRVITNMVSPNSSQSEAE
jgi:hypothetical protein